MKNPSELLFPPQEIFADISKSYDLSIVVYFQILQWTLALLIFVTILCLPAIIYCQIGHGIFGTYHFSLETFTLANLSYDIDDTGFYLIVLCDTLFSLVFLLLPLILRYQINNRGKQINTHIPPLNQWAVYLKGLPHKTIDPGDLEPIFVNYRMHEVYLVRDFRGKLFLHREKVFSEKLMKLEIKKLKILTPFITSKQIYARQKKIENIKSELVYQQSNLSEQFNSIQSPDDSQSIGCYAVFKSKLERNKFYENYNQNCCLKYKPKCGSNEIQVEDATVPSEIKWENMDHQNAVLTIMAEYSLGVLLLLPSIVVIIFAHSIFYQDPINCLAFQNIDHQSDDICLTMNVSVKHFFVIFLSGMVIVICNEIALYLLQILIKIERSPFIVREQVSIFIRSTSFLLINSLVLIIVLDSQIFNKNFGHFLTQPFQFLSSYEKKYKLLIYSSDIDRKWLINSGIKFIWVAIGNSFANLIRSILVVFYKRHLEGDDLEVLDKMWSKEEDDRQEEEINLSFQHKNKMRSFFLGNVIMQELQTPKEDLVPPIKIKILQRLRHDSPIINSNEDFDVGKGYARFLASFSICYIFCGPIPILSFVSVLSITMQFIADKYMIINYHSYNQSQGKRLQLEQLKLGIIVLKLFPILLLLHLLVSITTFGSDFFFFNQGILSKNNSNVAEIQVQIQNKALKVLPLTILLVLTILTIIVDFILSTFYHDDQINNNKYNKVGIDIDEINELDYYLPLMEEADILTSYNLQKNENYVELLKSVKYQTIADIQNENSMIPHK